MPKSSNKARSMAVRPDVFQFHDYRAFLKIWLEYRKRTERGFSLRSLARQSGLSAAYLPLVLGESRSLSPDAFSKLSPHLGLNESERDYFRLLRELGEATSMPQRLEAVEKMQKVREYRSLNPNEIEAYQYLSHWYYVAIREMAAAPGFRADPEWIRKQLGGRVTVGEARAAIRFLVERGYLSVNPEGKAKQTKKDVECVGGIYRVALGQFHREIFAVVGDVVEKVESEKRNVQGYTFAFSADRFDEVKQILDEAMKKIEKVGERPGSADTVYHAGVFAVPLTGTDKE